MKFLPYESYSFVTELTIGDVRQRLLESIGAREIIYSSPCSPRDKEFDGIVDGDKFKLTRQNANRNSFRPIIMGEISEQAGAVQVRIKMRMMSSVSCFIIFIYGFLLLIQSLAILSIVRESKAVGMRQFLGFLPFWIFPYGIVMVGFKSESIMAKKFLSVLLEEKKI